MCGAAGQGGLSSTNGGGSLRGLLPALRLRRNNAVLPSGQNTPPDFFPGLQSITTFQTIMYAKLCHQESWPFNENAGSSRQLQHYPTWPMFESYALICRKGTSITQQGRYRSPGPSVSQWKTLKILGLESSVLHQHLFWHYKETWIPMQLSLLLIKS